MFTGIVESLGSIAQITASGSQGGSRFLIEVGEAGFLDDVVLGDSISVDGACLTAVALSPKSFEVDTAPVTLERTTLGERRKGDTVNLEKAMAAGGRFGGHFVTGHVDAVGRIRTKKPQGNAILVDIEAPEWFNNLLIDRGSVTVDGISLTVAFLKKDIFTVSIIPHTSTMTTITGKASGLNVNLEADMIGKYVKRFVDLARTGESGISLESLERHGFA